MHVHKRMYAHVYVLEYYYGVGIWSCGGVRECHDEKTFSALCLASVSACASAAALVAANSAFKAASSLCNTIGQLLSCHHIVVDIIACERVRQGKCVS